MPRSSALKTSGAATDLIMSGAMARTCAMYSGRLTDCGQMLEIVFSIAAIAPAHVGFVSSIRRKNETSVILITANSRRCVHEGVYLYSGMLRKCGARLTHAAFCTSMRPSHTVRSLSQACRITAFFLRSRSENTW
jgi:hypothetical protein